MYDSLSSDYDRFVDWTSRLAYEMPFIIKCLKQVDAHTVVDSACGTGMHAIALAHEGYWVVGADLSEGMIDVARANARRENLPIVFEVAGFGDVSKTFPEPADAVLCLGNSLPHVLDKASLALALQDFADNLRPGGLLLLQSRNFDAVMATHERWMEPQTNMEGDKEWLFVRFYDFNPDGLITFNILTLKHDGDHAWKQSLTTTQLKPLLWKDLRAGLLAAGFRDVKAYGSMTGEAFNAGKSGNLVVTAIKAG
jgi:SAM-dependent methyltransferase